MKNLAEVENEILSELSLVRMENGTIRRKMHGRGHLFSRRFVSLTPFELDLLGRVVAERMRFVALTPFELDLLGRVVAERAYQYQQADVIRELKGEK